MSKTPVRSRFSLSGLRITRGALIVAGLELGFSLVWLLADVQTRATISTWLEAIPTNVFEHGRVWTLATGVFLERDLVALILHISVLWMFVPTLERFWGTARFYRFVIITSLIGTAVGGGAGTGVVLSTRGKEVHLGKGAALTLRLAAPLTIRIHG